MAAGVVRRGRQKIWMSLSPISSVFASPLIKAQVLFTVTKPPAMKTLLLFLAYASIAHSRPGETQTQIEKRLGPARPQSDYSRSYTSSMRERCRVFAAQDALITIYFWDNKSVREEYAFRHNEVDDEKEFGKSAELIDAVLKAVGNGANWTIEFKRKADPELAEERESEIKRKGLYFLYLYDAFYKTTGLTARRLERFVFAVETDEFRKLRESKTSKTEQAPRLGEDF